jgi:hypothetical protein
MGGDSGEGRGGEEVPTNMLKWPLDGGHAVDAVAAAVHHHNEKGWIMAAGKEILKIETWELSGSLAIKGTKVNGFF